MNVMSTKEGTHVPPGSDTNYLYITILCVVSTNYREYIISHFIIILCDRLRENQALVTKIQN